MIADLSKKWEYENGYWLTGGADRVGKALNQWELFKQAPKDGDIVELGVFKGASFARLAMYRDLLGHDGAMYGFDTFADFPESKHDQKFIDDFLKQAGEGATIEEIRFYLDSKGTQDYHLVEGDIFDTLPLWLHIRKPKLSLVNIDLDAYEPTKFALNMIMPYMVQGGVIMFDDYAHCEGAKKAIEEALSGGQPAPMPYYKAPYYIKTK